jgi:hypothetical protein
VVTKEYDKESGEDGEREREGKEGFSLLSLCPVSLCKNKQVYVEQCSGPIVWFVYVYVDGCRIRET